MFCVRNLLLLRPKTSFVAIVSRNLGTFIVMDRYTTFTLIILSVRQRCFQANIVFRATAAPQNPAYTGATPATSNGNGHLVRSFQNCFFTRYFNPNYKQDGVDFFGILLLRLCSRCEKAVVCFSIK